MSYEGPAGICLLLPFLFIIAIGAAVWLACGGPENLALQHRLDSERRDAWLERFLFDDDEGDAE